MSQNNMATRTPFAQGNNEADNGQGSPTDPLVVSAEQEAEHPVTLDEDDLEALERADRIFSRFLEIQNRFVAAKAAAPTARKEEDTRPAPKQPNQITWSDLPELSPGNNQELDRWFLQFEMKMAACEVPLRLYKHRWEACPKIPPGVKTSALCTGARDYKELREQMLREFGPTYPYSIGATKFTR